MTTFGLIPPISIARSCWDDMSSDDVIGEDFTGWTLEKPGDPFGSPFRMLFQVKFWRLDDIHSYGHLPVISGYKWDYTFYKWGYKYLYLINGHNCGWYPMIFRMISNDIKFWRFWLLDVVSPPNRTMKPGIDPKETMKRIRISCGFYLQINAER